MEALPPGVMFHSQEDFIFRSWTPNSAKTLFFISDVYWNLKVESITSILPLDSDELPTWSWSRHQPGQRRCVLGNYCNSISDSTETNIQWRS